MIKEQNELSQLSLHPYGQNLILPIAKGEKQSVPFGLATGHQNCPLISHLQFGYSELKINAGGPRSL